MYLMYFEMTHMSPIVIVSGSVPLFFIMATLPFSGECRLAICYIGDIAIVHEYMMKILQNSQCGRISILLRK